MKTWAQLFDHTPAIPREKLQWWLSDRLDASLTNLPLQDSVSDADQLAFEEAVSRLKKGEPVQYVCGRAPFRELEIKVDKRVLIPRPETEQLVQIALDHYIKPGDRIFDVGTGSGCIALALKNDRPDCQVTGLDISADAIDLARENADVLGLDVSFHQADLLAGQPFRSAEIIIANLPYIGKTEEAALPAEVRDFEPHLALFSGEDGSDLILRLLDEAKKVLMPNGTLLLETGENQSEIWQAAADRLGWQLEGRNDLADRPRFWILKSKGT